MNNLLFAGRDPLCLFSKPGHAQNKLTAASLPVTRINVFTVPAGKETEVLEFWEKGAKFLKARPGSISTALHGSIQPNAKHSLINIAKCEKASRHSEMQSRQSGQPSASSP
ncbi:MAG: antibiotic biosynthesis monooxygenase family protein [Hyphomicrobiaceae bacterium]